MNIIVIAVGLVTLFVFPLVAYGVMWVASRSGGTERPEPPDPHESRRTIPGHNSDN